jgi:hypothetical protein
MESDIIIISDKYEIHPGAKGGFVIVAVQTGETVASFSTLAEAKRAAAQYA